MSISNIHARGRFVPVLALLPFLIIGSTATTSSSAEDKTSEGRRDVSDLYIVDCLLPGQVRMVGRRTYITPRRPSKKTAADCRIAGGEYVAYDRADYKSALRVWMAAAEAGDAEAQNTVGEIFERGLGGEPNYEPAVIWYQKAADQGNKRALLNLGTLYEQGKGVKKDRLQALNYYRRSWGLEEDSLIYQSAHDQRIKELRSELDKQIQERNTQIRLLQKQLDALDQQSSRTPDQDVELEDYRAWVNRLRIEQSAGQTELDSLPKLREPSAAALPDASFANEVGRNYGGRKFGRYYALIVGNEDYEKLEDLESPISDVTKLARLLEQKYGFTVQSISNANDVTMLEAINNLNSVIGKKDNLLIYYAGHGSRVSVGDFESGYWLPVNADKPPNTTFWIPTEQITDHMATFKAKRVLVIADSCYSGILDDDPSMVFMSENARAYNSEGYVDLRFDKKSRLLLSSGGDRPVMDGGGGENSIFAKALLDELERNDGLLTTPALFLRLRDRISASAASQNFDQEPEIKGIRRAGHEVGDFFFIPIG